MIKLDLENVGISGNVTIHIPLIIENNKFYLSRDGEGIFWKDTFYKASKSTMNYNVCEQDFVLYVNGIGGKTDFYVSFDIKDIEDLNETFITYLLEYFRKCESIADKAVKDQTKLILQIGPKLKELSKLDILK